MPSSSMWPLPLHSRVNHVIAGKTITEHVFLIISQEIDAETHTWISPNDQATLLQSGNATLNTESGTKLASIGDGNEHLSTKDSFFIKYPWNLLNIAEDVIGSITESSILGELHENASVQGNLVLGKGSKVLPGVFIEGNVVVGENCKIGPNCYIRGNTSIGNNCKIGQSVEIKNSIIGNHTNVAHLSYVGDSVLGENVNFGAGTLVSNYRHDKTTHKSMVEDKLIDTGRLKFGTVIGDSVNTGINTSIYPGRKLQQNSSTLPCEVVHKDIAL